MTNELKENLDIYQKFLEWYRSDDDELEQNAPNDSDERHKYWLYMSWLAGRNSAKEVSQQEPYGWMITGVPTVMKGSLAEDIQKAEAKRIGGTCKAFPIYLKGN